MRYFAEPEPKAVRPVALTDIAPEILQVEDLELP